MGANRTHLAAVNCLLNFLSICKVALTSNLSKIQEFPPRKCRQPCVKNRNFAKPQFNLYNQANLMFVSERFS